MFKTRLLCISISLASFCTPLIASAGNDDYFDMTLDELVNIQVTSVSKKSESAATAAAALFVVTNEDIQRTGATSLAEALRIVPGLDVARIDANKWAVSARGFNRQHANKLLVMVDGRSIYTPMFSGVYWDEHDVPLEDVERIEVIRGPGASLWGSNAVNGIINIVTKHAKDTQGNLASVSVGNNDFNQVNLRHGGKIGNTDYRIFARHNMQGDSDLPKSGVTANDGWIYDRVGFRTDTALSAQEDLSVQMGVHDSKKDSYNTVPILTAPYSRSFYMDENFREMDFLTKYTNRYQADASYEAQFYVDSTVRENEVYGFSRNIFDFDFQHNFKATDTHELTWGTGYRYMSDDAESIQYLIYNPDRRVYDIISGFVQDKISLIKDKVFLTLGIKYEHNDFTGHEWQPNVRTSWQIDDKNTLWAAVSRAVRTPTRNENDLNIRVLSLPPNYLAPGTPASFVMQGGRNKNFESEDLIAYEVGYKSNALRDTTFDVSLFFNDYDNLRTFDLGTPYFATEVGFPTHLAIPLTAHNYGKAESYGAELAVTHQLTNDLRVMAGYTYLDMDMGLNAGSRDNLFLSEAGRNPEHQFNARTYYNVTRDIEWDTMLYYVDEITSVDAYTRLDTRVGWRALKGLELSAMVQNIFDDEHQEFNESTLSQPADIGRLFYVKASFTF